MVPRAVMEVYLGISVRISAVLLVRLASIYVRDDFLMPF